jgi:hypothetical protein
MEPVEFGSIDDSLKTSGYPGFLAFLLDKGVTFTASQSTVSLLQFFNTALPCFAIATPALLPTPTLKAK